MLSELWLVVIGIYHQQAKALAFQEYWRIYHNLMVFFSGIPSTHQQDQPSLPSSCFQLRVQEEKEGRRKERRTVNMMRL